VEIRDVQKALDKHGLVSPHLEILRPTADRYRAFLLQPAGPITVSKLRIGPLNPDLAEAKGREFLKLAHGNHAHLAVTPEYFLPWLALKSAIAADIVPAVDALWILGCESATPAELEKVKAAIGTKCLVIDEAMPDANGVFYDPVVLLFHAKTKDNATRLVAIFQFKVIPSKDELSFEEYVLKRGKYIYKFRAPQGPLFLAAIICSDAFGLTDALIGDLAHLGTLVHVQLNPKPRDSDYRKYRTQIFSTDENYSRCHIVCLNWAQRIVQHNADGQQDPWGNVAGSAWYCPFNACSVDDEIVIPNHMKGLYYATLKELRHAVLFDYNEAVFDLKVPKVVTTGSAKLAIKTGPIANARYAWSANEQWEVAEPSDSGYAGLLQNDADAKAAIEELPVATNALGVERVLALTSGSASYNDQWSTISNIDSFQIGPDEIVNRITFAQDTNVSAVKFRHDRLMCAVNLRHALTNADVEEWPLQVKDLSPQARFHWDPALPQFNVISSNGVPALVVHLGDAPTEQAIENIPDKTAELLRREGVHPTRLCVVYTRLLERKFARVPFTRYDDALATRTDFLAVEPVK